MQQEKETAQESCGKLTDHRDTLWCSRQIYAVKGGKKSGLVTLRTAEREGQAGEFIRHSTSPNIKLSPSYFAWICITFSIFSSFPNLTLNILFFSTFPPNLPSFLLNTQNEWAMAQWLHRNLRWPASNQTEKGNKRMRRTDFCVLPCSEVVVAGEGTACIFAVSNALAKPCLSTKLLKPGPKRELRTQIPLLLLSQHHHIHVGKNTLAILCM